MLLSERLKQITSETQTRSHAIELREADPDNPDNRTMTFSFSSELPVERWWGNEVLSHDAGAADLSRLNNGAAFLWNHDRDKVLGVVKSAWLDSDHRGYCTIRWSAEEEAQKYKRQVDDGILSNVSFAYSIKDAREVGENFIVTKWYPFEVSLVSIPADPTVGVGRAYQSSIEGKNIEKVKVMEPEININDVRAQERQSERDRIASITALGKRHNLPELAEQLIEKGTALADARALFLERIESRHQEPVAQPVNPLGLSEKEQRSYSIVRAINAAVTGDWSKAGFERECHLEILKHSGKGESKGVFVPVRDLKVESRAPYTVGTPATGGNLVATELLAENFIDLLRNRVMAKQLGATMLSGLSGNVAIPRQTSQTATYWVAENGAVTEGEATFDQVPLTPKTIGARSQLSRLMLLQPSIDIEQFIRMDFAKVIALGIDLAIINGSGVSNQPRGILQTPGIGSVVLGTNGDIPSWESIVALETRVAQANADIGSLAYFTNAVMRGKLKTTLKSTSSVSEFIWQDYPQMEGMGMVNGYKAGCSNQVPSNLTKGTGTNLSAMLFGNWADVIVGEWGVLEILPNPYGPGYNSGAVDIRVLQTIDIAIRHPESFATITDAIAS
jgi:HK97 family phage major capsid protein/HK97 family phage prohead protease